MSLEIKTFTNADHKGGWRPGNNAGGHSLFKALGHPLAAKKARALVERCKAARSVAVLDLDETAAAFHALYPLDDVTIDAVYVQRVEDIGNSVIGHDANPLTALPDSNAEILLVMGFDAERIIAPFRHLIPEKTEVLSLDEIRLGKEMLTNPQRYTDPLNFATNFALLRDIATDGDDGLHTRVVTANYWGHHGATAPRMWLCLFDREGEVLAEWHEAMPGAGATFVIDSAEVRRRFGLEDFTGSLFMHALGIAGHDIVKYALDIYGGEGKGLSCTHDANAWPADYYAGIPAPEADEDIIIHIQNSHPLPIRPGSVGLNLMGSQDIAWFDEEVPPFGTYPLRVSELLPDARWPQQIELVAGKHFVRPRYEVLRRDGRRRIAHANVERADLEPDPGIPALENTMGKGYIMPLPVLPTDRFQSVLLPTPMARSQHELPVRAELYDQSGEKIADRYLGRIARRESVPLAIDDWLADEGKGLPSGAGHVEFLYDFRDGGEADGWLHALGKYTQRESGHTAETIFGAHIYNTPIIYRDEPQSYINKPPGLTTRLFLRIGRDVTDTICHLVYPASLPWHPMSSTRLILHDKHGREVSETTLEIPCGGSRFWRMSETFSEESRAKAGEDAYVIVRDTTCRLFGFHGLVMGETAFCLDHMFGF